MAPGTDVESAKLYVDSLRWRRGELQSRLASLRAQIGALTEEEAELKSQLRAIEQLLAADGAHVELVQQVANPAPPAHDAAIAGGSPDSNGDSPLGPVAPSTFDYSDFGPTARRIYTRAEQVLREAGVPLHYRALAEEIEKTVPLSGVDGGATLIAHLHRAQDIFPRFGRGVYGLNGVTPGIPEERKQSASPTPRRRKTRRRTR